MPRIARQTPGGLVYHVLNRANGKLRMFKNDADFQAFEHVLKETAERFPMRILDWCLMGNHWHLVLWPKNDGDLTAFMRWMTMTHAQRWKHAHCTVGQGHLYQGRFKSFPIEQDGHLLTTLRYVERNPVRAGILAKAERYRWGSAFVRTQRSHELRGLLHAWPVDRPRGWIDRVNEPQTAAEEAAIKLHIQRGRPLGSENWTKQIVKSLGLEQTVRPRGRQPGWRKPPAKKERQE